MPNPDAVLTVNFNMKLDQDTDAKLIGLADNRHEKKAATVRALIRSAALMTLQNTPVCADGTPCRCPHAHVHIPPSPPLDAAVGTAHAQ